MKNNIEEDLTVENVRQKVINPKTSLPYTSPKESWSIPVYFIWRIIRYDLGEDSSYPAIAQGMIANHPQEAETKQILLKIESQYPVLKGYDEIRRIV